MKDNTLVAIFLCVLLIWFVLVVGDPDLLDAIIFNFTGGALKP
jgi:hypothetical protein